MRPARAVGNGSRVLKNGDDIAPSASALFAILWNALADMLGTAAAAAIVRRAAGRAASHHPELVQLVVLREELEYRYTLPESWMNGGRVPTGLHVLVAEIGGLLVELTGTVVVRHLEGIPELRASKLVWRKEEET